MVELLGPPLSPQPSSSPTELLSDNTRHAAKPHGSVNLDPLVSVIVPFFNVQTYIEECIVSILGQNYDKIELIFVDDASPDGSRAIVERYAAENPHIMILAHERNQGLGAARNTGVRHVSGEYLFFLDSDDLLSAPGAIRSLVSAARIHGKDIVVGACVELFENGAMSDRDLAHARGMRNASGGEVRGMDAFLAGQGISSEYFLPSRAWGALIDRKFYCQLGLDYPSGEHEDLGHTPFLYAMANGVYFLADNIVTYRARSGSISQSRWTKGHVMRYRDLWRGFKANVRRFSLDDELSLCSMQLAGHMIWRMETNRFEPDAWEEAVSLLMEMFKDITVVSDSRKFFNFVDRVRKFVGHSPQNSHEFPRLVSALPHGAVMDYYYDQLGLSPVREEDAASLRRRMTPWEPEK